MTKAFQHHKMKTVADFYNKRHERNLPEPVENNLGKKVIDLTFQDDNYFLNEHFKNIIVNDHTEFMS